MRHPGEYQTPGVAEPVAPGTVTPDPPPPPGDDSDDADLDFDVSKEDTAGERRPDEDVDPETAGPEPPD